MSGGKGSIPVDAIDKLLAGASLLKFGRQGNPHFRDFSLSEDFKYITWISKGKRKDDTRFPLSQCTLLEGQKTAVFKKNDRDDLRHLSFSLDWASNNKTLDLVCSDMAQYRLWKSTLQFLILHPTLTKTDVFEARRKVTAVEQSTRWARKIGRRNSQSAHSLSVLGGAAAAGKLANDKQNHGMQMKSEVYAFGHGGWGELGHDDSLVPLTGTPSCPPLIVKQLLGRGVEQMVCGFMHTLALTDRGNIWSFGNGGSGRLGTGKTDHVYEPKLIDFGDDASDLSFEQLACGDHHCLAVTSTGEMYSWGCNSYGQLGQGDDIDLKEPRSANLICLNEGQGRAVAVVAASNNFSALITNQHELYTFGCGDFGCLGHGDTEHQIAPKMVEKLAGRRVTDVVTGDFHVTAIIDDEHSHSYMWSWGANDCGQLGLGDFTDRLFPTRIEAISGSQMDITSISAGSAHVCCVVVLRKVQAHVVYSWGAGMKGQNARGDELRNVFKPMAVDELKAPLIVSCGSNHTACVTQEGKLFMWGDNSAGQCGMDIKDRPFVSTPTQVPALASKKVRTAACGGRHTCVTVAREWINDEEATGCMDCGAEFTFTRRRHHCRNCGGIFCGNCTTKKMAILSLGHVNKVRVCENCYAEAQGA